MTAYLSSLWRYWWLKFFRVRSVSPTADGHRAS